jgi:TPR repeat protein
VDIPWIVLKAEAKCCPKCNCTDPIIEPLPFVKCRENDCGSIIHKKAKHCPKCGYPDPASRDASTPKSDDYASAGFLVKGKGEKPERFTTDEIIKKIKIGQILPQQKITIDGPDEYQLWRPAYYYLPFSGYEDFDAAAEKAAAEKAAAEKVVAEKAAAEKAQKKLNLQFLLALSPTFFLSLGSLAGLLMTKFFFHRELDSLRIDLSNINFKILGAAITFGLTLCVYRRFEGAAFALIFWYLLLIILLYFTALPSEYLISFGLLVTATIGGLVCSIRLMDRLGPIRSRQRKKLPLVVDENDPEAQFKLGKMYHKSPLARDWEEAIKWYGKAAEQNHAGAQFNLGEMYKEGRGVPLDEKEAEKWYQKAADQGHEDACSALKVISE